MNKPPTVIVIEDDESDFQLIKEGLEKDPRNPEYTIKWYSEFPESVTMLVDDDPDVLVIDYRLGMKTGMDLAREYRVHDQMAGIVLLTGMAEQDFEDISTHSGGVGISDFLSKRSLGTMTLARSVRFALESSQQRRALREQSRLLENVLRTGKSALRADSLVDGGDLFFSESIESLTGYSKAELESSSVKWLDRVVAEDRDNLLKALDTVDNEERQVIYRFCRKDGVLIWIQETSQIRVDSNRRERLQVTGYLQDISNRYDREKNMRLMASSLDQSSEAVIITDSNLQAPGPTIIYVNGATECITGYDKSELIGQSPRILQGPKTDRELLDRLKRECAEGNEFSGTTINHRKSGEEYFVRWKIRPIRDSDGVITNFISTQRDVTEEHQSRIESQRNQNFLEEIGQLVKVGGWRIDLNPSRLFWTDQVYRIHGLEPGREVSLEQAYDFYSEKSREQIKFAVENCLGQAIPFDLILAFRNAKGQDLWVRAKGEPVISYGEITGVWGIFQDITEFQKMRHQTEIFYNLAADLSCIVSKEGQFLELNERWESVIGYTIEELRSIPIWDLVHPDDLAESRQALEEGLRVGYIYNFENRYLHKNGSYVHFLWNVRCSPDGLSVYALARDITELKEKAVMLEEALQQAHQASESKNQFLMVMSHEMRTPLNPILGFADLLLRDIKDPEQRVKLEYIKSSAEHMASLVSDVLDISSIEAGRVKILKEPADLLQIASSSIASLESKAEAKGLSLVFKDNGFLQADPKLVCLVDKLKIRQALLNLVSNAIKFTRSGSVTLEFVPPVWKDSSADFCIKIIDTGIGISEDQLESIFERFYQVSMTSSREFGGQGLGLALSRQLARCMGGDIEVESEYGKGSVFSFRFSAEVISGGEVREGADVKPERPGDQKLSGLRVLLVEDEPINQMVLMGILKRVGVQFQMAANGVEALELIDSSDFDVVLMDIQMPDLDGIEATRRIRSGRARNASIPIYALSAHAVTGIKKSGFEAGMNGFLEKPVSIKAITSALEKAAANISS